MDGSAASAGAGSDASAASSHVPGSGTGPGVYVRPPDDEFNSLFTRPDAPYPWVPTDYVPKVNITPSVFRGAPPPTGSDFNPGAILESCPVKAGLSGIMGGGMGLMMGVFVASFQTTGAPQIEPDGTVRHVPLRQAIKEMGKSMGAQSKSYGKSFAQIGLYFSLTECVIEKFRGRHDLKNSVFAGGITGALISRKSGPAGMALSAAGFAAFSVVIDKVME